LEFRNDKLPESLGQQTVVDLTMHGHVKRSLGLRLPQDGSIGHELTHRLFQVTHGRWAEKALDFDSNGPVSLLGANGRSFRPDIDVEIPIAE
jgi:hypothetical protein